MDIPEVAGIVKQLQTVIFPQFKEYEQIFTSTFDWFEAYKETVTQQLLKLKNDRDSNVEPISKSVKRRAVISSSDDEDRGFITESTTQAELSQLATAAASVTSPVLGKRNAARKACLQINSQSSMKLNTKLRRPDVKDKENFIDNVSTIQSSYVKVKIEDRESTNTTTVESLAQSVLIDATNDVMPPPAIKPKRGRKKIKKEVIESSDTEPETNVRSTRSKRIVVKKEYYDISSKKISSPVITEPIKKTSTVTRSKQRNRRIDSDIIIQEIPVPLVIIDDSDEELLSNVRTKMAEKKQTDTEVEEKNSKRERKKKTKITKNKEKIILDGNKGTEVVEKPNKNVKQEISMYEDANSEMKQLEVINENIVNATITYQNSNLALNTSNALTETTRQENPLNNTHEMHKDSLKDNGVSMNSTHILAKEAPQNNSLNNTHLIRKDSPSVNCSVILHKLNETLNMLQNNSTHILAKEVAQIHSLNNTHLIRNESPLVNCSVTLHKLNETQTLNILQNKTYESPLKPQVAPKPTYIPQKSSHKSPQLPEQSIKSPESQKPHNILKATPSELAKPFLMPSVSNIMTDDDDSIEVFKTPEKKVNKKKAIKTKPMFSPYAESPVKKRVAAFEKLGGVDEMPTRVTRTKTRNMAAKENQAEAKNTEPARTLAKPKFKTPLIANKIPSLIPHTDGKIYHNTQLNLGSKYNNSAVTDVSIKSSTAIKPSRVELQERKEEEQKRRLEKEDDAKRKKEQMMLAKTEEQRRKREEKQAKAQKTREAMEKEKEDKLRQMIQEKEQKQLEEIQKRREWEQMKAAELEMRKKKEEKIRQQKIKEHEARRKLEEKRKQQLNIKPPPLPTEDWEDSDSSSETVKPRCEGPIWGQRKQLEPKLLAQRYIPKSFIETYFQMHAQTPDLREIFETIDERALRRNSSAVWRTPPRYSTLPKF